jgi:hypothetical protein
VGVREREATPRVELPGRVDLEARVDPEVAQIPRGAGAIAVAVVLALLPGDDVGLDVDRQIRPHQPVHLEQLAGGLHVLGDNDRLLVLPLRRGLGAVRDPPRRLAGLAGLHDHPPDRFPLVLLAADLGLQPELGAVGDELHLLAPLVDDHEAVLGEERRVAAEPFPDLLLPPGGDSHRLEDV